MAGYLFTFSDSDSLFRCIEQGWYSPLMSLSFTEPAAGTLGDFATMKPGDNVYLFSKRIVYGIGEVVEIAPSIAVAENHLSSTSAAQFTHSPADPPLLCSDMSELKALGKMQRWFIVFKPSPQFFCSGIDMDDLLSSDPVAFRSLRVFWNRTFIKLDDEENRAFKAAILRRNYNRLNDMSASLPCHYEITLSCLALTPERIHKPDVTRLLREKRLRNGKLSSEMLLEAAMLTSLSDGDQNAVKAFGDWDYLSHQIPASPMKAVEYMDKIDVFGYSWISGYENEIIGRYCVAELKKDKISPEDVPQIMKYVDWVCREYANGDYTQIQAFLVGATVDLTSFDAIAEAVERNYLIGVRPPINNVWRSLSLVTYDVDLDGKISFTRVADFSELEL